MKAVIVLCFVAVAAVALARPDEKYTDRYDNINLDELLANKILLTKNVDCLLGTGKCTPATKELTSHVEDAMKTDCAKCTDAQRRGTDKVITHLIVHEPKIWEELKAKYDPTGLYAPGLEKRLRGLVESGTVKKE